MKVTTRLWIGLAILVVLSPLGLILPERFKAGAAWGEWGAEEMEKLIGYIPRGLEKISAIWNAPLPDYVFRGWEGKGLSHLSLGYLLSAVAGISIIVIVMLLLGKILSKKR